jgi:pyridoxine 5-phosphate synthase
VIETRINLEMAASDDMIAIALRLRPADCCLVPERREELTTEGGLDVAGQLERIRVVSRRLAAAGIRVSLFIDPDPRQIEAACAASVPVVELHTGLYADAAKPGTRQVELTRVGEAARQAAERGLIVHAGHGLNYHNVMPIAAISEVAELNIGHAIVARAVFMGLGEAVREMKRLMGEARLRVSV